jgi:hypothetical protein
MLSILSVAKAPQALVVHQECSVSSRFVLGLHAATARKLLFTMKADDQLVFPRRGVYELSDERATTLEGDVSHDVTEGVDVTADVTELEESGEAMPILGESPTGIYGWSELDQAMIPKEESRRNKGYVG